MSTYTEKDLQQREDGHYLHPVHGYAVCGAHSRGDQGDGLCLNKAGKGTRHLGIGRCRHHGGTLEKPHSLVKRYGLQAHLQFPEIAALVEKLSENRDVFNFRDHIHVLEAMSLHMLNNQELMNSARVLVEVTKAMERLHEIEVGRKMVITVVDVKEILSRVVQIIDRYVIDEHTRSLIAKDLAGIRINAAEAPPMSKRLIDSKDYEEVQD